MPHFHPRLARRWGLPFLILAILLAISPMAAFAAVGRVVTRVAPATAGVASPEPDEPRLVRVDLTGTLTPESLMDSGIDVIESRRGNFAMILERPGDEAILARLGAHCEVIDEHPGRTAAEQARNDLATRPRPAGRRVLSANDATGRFSVQTLPAFGAGSMAGFWTLSEVKTKLDDLVASDVHEVVADKIDTIGYSIQGRPIWGLRLCKALPGPETRPVAFYNALTHAREPEGMQALFYFVDDLLSKYGTDPAATYLLNHRVIYIVPVVNPDGYRFNQTKYDSTGLVGYHRKNLRDVNGDGVSQIETDGVDLNRNYGYMWGGPGAGTNPSDLTYRGASPFSEPETQAQSDLVISLQPKAGISFHTYGDLLMHPWGFQNGAANDSLEFYEWSDDMSVGNGYQSGQATRILYQVSGEFTDWCWGDEASKPRFPAWTPEVGTPLDMFWPLPSRIVPLAQENLRECYYVAAIAGPYVRVESSTLLEGALNQGGIAHLTLRARNKGTNGLAGPGLLAALSPLSAGAHVLEGIVSLPALGPLQSGDPVDNGRFVISSDDTVTLGRVLRFQVDFSTPESAGGLFSRDTVEVLCGTPTVLLYDDGNTGITKWTGMHNTWNTESDDAYRPGPFLADSPIGPETYDNKTDAVMITANPLDLSRSVHAYLTFSGRWEFETDLDCGTVEANVSGTTWTPLPGASTSRGQGSSGSKQPVGQPVYDGARRFWRPERVDLSSVAGPGATAVKIRFRVQSSSSPVFDGFRLDDIQIVTFDPAAQPVPVAVGDGPSPTAVELAPPVPNPARGPARLDFALPQPGRVRLEVLDLQGRRVRSLADRSLSAGRYAFGWDLRDPSGHAAAPGVYLVRLATPERTLVRRLVVLQ
jgi:carboxypeptidase T